MSDKLTTILYFQEETPIGLTTPYGIVNSIGVRVQVFKGDANWFDTSVLTIFFIINNTLISN